MAALPNRSHGQSAWKMEVEDYRIGPHASEGSKGSCDVFGFRHGATFLAYPTRLLRTA